MSQPTQPGVMPAKQAQGLPQAAQETLALDYATLSTVRGFAERQAAKGVRKSLGFWLDYLIDRGVKAHNHYTKSAEKYRSRRDFVDAITRNPRVLLDSNALVALAVKHGIAVNEITAILASPVEAAAAQPAQPTAQAVDDPTPAGEAEELSDEELAVLTAPDTGDGNNAT